MGGKEEAVAHAHLGPRFSVFFVGHFACARKVEFGEIGGDGSEKVGFNFENIGKDSVELALVRVPLVNDVEQGSSRIRWQASGGMPASPARVNHVQRVHLEAASPENAVLQAKSASVGGKQKKGK